MKSLVDSEKCTNFAPRNQGIVPRWLKTIEKMDNSKGLEWFKKNLKVVIDGKDSKLSELEAKIKGLQSENRILKSYNDNLDAKIKYLQSDYRNLKSYIDYLGCQNKELRIKNENLESDVKNYKELLVHPNKIEEMEINVKNKK